MARAWKARNPIKVRGFKSLPLRHRRGRHAAGHENSCVLIASPGAGSCAAEHWEPRQDRKVATVTSPLWVTRGCLVCWRSDQNARIFRARELPPLDAKTQRQQRDKQRRTTTELIRFVRKDHLKFDPRSPAFIRVQICLYPPLSFCFCVFLRSHFGFVPGLRHDCFDIRHTAARSPLPAASLPCAPRHARLEPARHPL